MNVFLQSSLIISGLVFLAGLAAGVYWAITGRIKGAVSVGLMMLGFIMVCSAVFTFSGRPFDAPLAQPEG